MPGCSAFVGSAPVLRLWEGLPKDEIALLTLLEEGRVSRIGPVLGAPMFREIGFHQLLRLSPESFAV